MSAVAAAAAASEAYRLAEFHEFESAGKRFLYLVPGGSIFELNAIGGAVVDTLRGHRAPAEEMVGLLAGQSYDARESQLALTELEHAGVVSRGEVRNIQPKPPEGEFPLQRIVLNVTNQCNLACGYCYEYSEDKISKTAGKPKYMAEETAQASIDMLIKESAAR